MTAGRVRKESKRGQEGRVDSRVVERPLGDPKKPGGHYKLSIADGLMVLIIDSGTEIYES